MATAGQRALPGFLVIGAMKSGSTALHEYLAQHPRIVSGKRKEMHFFDRRLRRGRLWYRSQFPRRSELDGGKLTGDATPTYLVAPHAPALAKALLRDAKLIVVLRDPAERAISHYFHQQARWKNEPLGLLEALQAEPKRLAPHLVRMKGDALYFPWDYTHYAYQHQGDYAVHLRRWIDAFGRDRLHVIESDELATDTATALRSTFEFLGVDPEFDVPNVQPRNVTPGKRGVDEAVYDHLRQRFAEPNEALFDLLGRRFDWCK